MPVVSMENISVFIPLILRGKVSGSGELRVAWVWFPLITSFFAKI